LLKFHGYITVGNVSPAKKQGINEKNEHYHWIICRHSIAYRFPMIVENCVG